MYCKKENNTRIISKITDMRFSPGHSVSRHSVFSRTIIVQFQHLCFLVNRLCETVLWGIEKPSELHNGGF